jgi:dTDP-4-dehydrorhamnose 3,5-epimerase-like enzyme
MIKRVQIINRRLIQDERGWFLKAITGKEESIPHHTGEVYLTMGKPGQMKGGHYHPLAVEWFIIIAGAATLKLEDVNTHERMEIKLRFQDARMVFVPNNVAHAFFNESDEDFILLAYTDRLYDPADTIAYQL